MWSIRETKNSCDLSSMLYIFVYVVFLMYFVYILFIVVIGDDTVTFIALTEGGRVGGGRGLS